MGAAILLWGWETGLLLWTAPLAVLVEASHWITRRWELSKSDLDRICDLAGLLGLGLAAFLYSSDQLQWGERSSRFSQWLPFPLVPIMLAQAFGSWEQIPLTSYFLLLRRAARHDWAGKACNFSYIFFAVCLMAASTSGGVEAAKLPARLFYPGVATLIGLALWAVRPKRVPLLTFILLIALAGVAGNGLFRGYRSLQVTLENSLGYWISRHWGRELDMRQTETAIGRVGRLHLSGRIVLRLQPEPGSPVPERVRQFSYNKYNERTWSAVSNKFEGITVGSGDAVSLLPAKPIRFGARIAVYLSQGRGFLYLPQGTSELHDLPVVLETNYMGVAKVQEGPGLLDYLATFGPGRSIDGPPGEPDLNVPDEERPVLAQVCEQLKLAEKTEPEKLQTIQQFFMQNFSYSMEIKTNHLPTGGRTFIGQFLTVARSGHCEYFATATVLLLRPAGIPARYATGYAVDPTSRSGKTYLVRERHGHAWVLYYRSGARHWDEFDTTPGGWLPQQDERISPWEKVSDFFSRIGFEISRWRWSKNSNTRFLVWLLIPLIAILLWRVVSRKRRQRTAPGAAREPEPEWPGKDSEFYLIDQRLTAAGLGRLPEEPLEHWQIGRAHV